MNATTVAVDLAKSAFQLAKAEQQCCQYSCRKRRDAIEGT